MAPCVYLVDGDTYVADQYMEYLSKRNPLKILFQDLNLFLQQSEPSQQLPHRALVVYGMDDFLLSMTRDVAIELDKLLLNIPVIIVILVVNKTTFSSGWEILKAVVDPPMTSRWLTGEE
jgi:hypothetical protein